MRKNIHSIENSQYKIIAVDDESGILDSLKVFLTKARI
jgi:HKD family nuclease